MIVGRCRLIIPFGDGVVDRSCPSTSPHEFDETVDVNRVKSAVTVHNFDKSSEMTFENIRNTFLSS